MTTNTNCCSDSCSYVCSDIKGFYHADQWVPDQTCEKIKSVAIGALTGLCVFAVMTTAFYFLQKHCSWFHVSQDVHKIFNLFKNVHPILNFVWKALWRGYAVLLGPVLEEIVFRGILNHHIAECQGQESTIKRVIRVFLTSFIFCLGHLSPFQNLATNVTVLTATFLIGMVFAILREIRKDLVSPAVAHMVYNLSAII